MTRGLRNNNPGNIRHGAKWLGLDPEGKDPDFATFVAPEFGIRAIAKVLKTYRTKHRLCSIQGIINRWAPPNENNTDAYVEHVAKYVGVSPYEFLSVFDDEKKIKLIKAIILHENGSQPYSDEVIAKGIELARG